MKKPLTDYFFYRCLITVTHLLYRTAWFCLLSTACFGQDAATNEVHQKVTAFGHMPTSVPDSLYIRLKNARSLSEKLEALYKLGTSHSAFGNADSVQGYAYKMDSLLDLNLDGLQQKEKFRIQAKRLFGDAKIMEGVPEAALKAYLEGISVSENKNLDPEKYWLKLGMARAYLQKGEGAAAQEVLEQCRKESKDLMIQARANFLLGVLAAQQEDFERAESYLTASASNIDKDSMPKFYLQIQLNQGKLLLEQKKYTQALDYFREVMQESLPQNFYDLYTEAVLNYGKCYSSLGEVTAAEMVLTMAYTNALNWNRLGLQKEIINSLRNLYAKKGDYQNAYHLMTQYNSVSQQILEQQNAKAVKELEFKYKTLEKEKEIFQLKEEQLVKENEIDRQKTIKKAFLFGFLILLVPIIGLLYVYYQKLQTQSQLNVQQQELSKQKIASVLSEQELKLARTALEAQQEERLRISQQLHDGIGGNLAGIKLQLSNLEDPGKNYNSIIRQVNDTYELVRDISHDLVPKKFLQNAFTLLIREHVQKIKRHSDIGFEFYAHPEEKIDALPESLKVELYQMIQELTTNTLKHAKANAIELHITLTHNYLQLLFEDNGVGFDRNKTATGIGLDNIEHRVKQLDGELLIDSSLGRGTVVNITIKKIA